MEKTTKRVTALYKFTLISVGILAVLMASLSLMDPNHALLVPLGYTAIAIICITSGILISNLIIVVSRDARNIKKEVRENMKMEEEEEDDLHKVASQVKKELEEDDNVSVETLKKARWQVAINLRKDIAEKEELLENDAIPKDEIHFTQAMIMMDKMKLGDFLLSEAASILGHKINVLTANIIADVDIEDKKVKKDLIHSSAKHTLKFIDDIHSMKEVDFIGLEAKKVSAELVSELAILASEEINSFEHLTDEEKKNAGDKLKDLSGKLNDTVNKDTNKDE